MRFEYLVLLESARVGFLAEAFCVGLWVQAVSCVANQIWLD